MERTDLSALYASLENLTGVARTDLSIEIAEQIVLRMKGENDG